MNKVNEVKYISFIIINSKYKAFAIRIKYF